MKNFQRYLQHQIELDIQKKMVFLGGPRQVGKTTLAKNILKKENSAFARDIHLSISATSASLNGYLNWDIPEDREKILKRQWPNTRIWVFDEMHKYRSWRNLLKGLSDQFHDQKKILVTGSARLDVYRRGGDSLQGRYHYLRLHPLSVSELKMKHQKEFLNLLQLGGFPEPFFAGNEIEAKRWSREYRTRLIQEDINSLERLQDLGNLELLMLRLPDLVGSPLSLNALREDLQISHKTVSHWLNILERLYAIFRITPFSSSKLRAVKKAQKHYHFDWTLIDDESLRFENMVACHLLKWVHFKQDAEGKDWQLNYFRDVDGREVDFIITEKNNPIMAVECKWNNNEINKGVQYIKQRFPNCQMVQISAIGTKEYFSQEGVRVMPALKFLQELI